MRASPGSIPHREAEQKQQRKGNCREIYNKLKEETMTGPVDHITQIATLSLRNQTNK
uniref:Sugar transporter n=1 Tax=Solanum tuberosum TaxID=4113 RepID=M1ANU7_SOLTU